MFISEKLRDIIYTHAGSGVAFLHVSKCGGSSVRTTAYKKNIPILDYIRIRGRHHPNCFCKEPMCADAREHELHFTRSVKNKKPWLLHLRHMSLSREEASDIPCCMQIVVPLRDNKSRVISLMKYDFGIYQYSLGAHIHLTPKHAFIFNLSSGGNRYGRLMFGRKHRIDALNLMESSSVLGRYIGQDGKTILWREWASAALAQKSPNMFWYNAFLPNLTDSSDIRWGRLDPTPMTQLNVWMKSFFGVDLLHVNRSPLCLPWDLESASRELAENVGSYTNVDDDLWRQLSSMASQS